MAEEATERRKAEETSQQSADAEPQSDWFTQRRLPDDVTLKFDDGKELFASRGLLMSASPVFEGMFTHDMKEKETNVVDMPGRNYDHFLEFLKCLNPRIDKPVTHENVYYLADLAHEYLIEKVFKRCLEVFTMIMRHNKGKLIEEDFQLSTLAPADTKAWLEANNTNNTNFNCRVSTNNINPANNILKVLSSVAKFQNKSLITEAFDLLSCIQSFDYDNIDHGFRYLGKPNKTTIKQNKALFDQLDADLRVKIFSARLKRIDIDKK